MADTAFHVFPVPPGWSPEQAWEHHSRAVHLTRAKEAEAVWAIGLGKAYRYLTNGGSR